MSKVETQYPILRLKEFGEEWTPKSLGNICAIGDIDHWMPSTVSEGIPYLMTGDFIGINELDFANAKLISKMDYCRLARKIKPEHGDILFARYASVGAVRYVNTDKQFQISYSCAILKSHKSYDSQFLFYNIQSPDFQNKIELEINTGSQRNIGIDSLKGLDTSLPSRKEQAKIGNFFENIDQQLKLHQAKYAKLHQLKKAMLGKMFPKQGATVPEVRFSEFNQDWDKGLLQDCFSFQSNNSLSRAELNYSSGLAMNVHYGDILVRFKEVLDVSTTKIPFVTNLKYIDKMMPNRLKDGDIIIADAAEDTSVGKCTEINNLGEQVLFSGLHTIAIRPSISFAPKYLGYLLNSNLYHDQLLPLMQGTKVLSISKSSIKDTLIYYPRDLDEQAKIGEYFHSLDRLIALQQQQISKLENIKQSFLEKMFV